MRRFQFNLMKFYCSTIAVARDVKTFLQYGQGGITVPLLGSVEIGGGGIKLLTRMTC